LAQHCWRTHSILIAQIANIAELNHKIFQDLQAYSNIDYRPINYVNFAHDEKTLKALEASMAWSDAFMLNPRIFRKEISPFIESKADQPI
jgi:hypothetical protein